MDLGKDKLWRQLWGNSIQYFLNSDVNFAQGIAKCNGKVQRQDQYHQVCVNFESVGRVIEWCTFIIVARHPQFVSVVFVIHHYCWQYHVWF